MDKVFKARLYAFTLRLISYVRSLPSDFVNRRMGDQLIRSGTSIIANMTEGGSAASRRDYANYTNHALKSANETHLWLSLLQDSGLRTAESEWLMREVTEIARILAATLITLRRSLRNQSTRPQP
ncbi:MAG: four helix bundle protein [Bacteroidetes bacterium]|jgi:four helix bundle protein|nr:four helix bundle protein [Bacteroidota bacterium]